MKQRAASSFTFIEPMKALRVPDLPSGNWLYEMKYDGYRALAFKSGSDVQLVSRNQTSFNKAYPDLIDALKLLHTRNAIIDGEGHGAGPARETFIPVVASIRKEQGNAFDLLRIRFTRPGRKRSS
jgi:ATP-dependent DNA ligase